MRTPFTSKQSRLFHLPIQDVDKRSRVFRHIVPTPQLVSMSSFLQITTARLLSLILHTITA